MQENLTESKIENLKDKSIIQVRNLYTTYGDHIVHSDLSFDVKQGEVFGILGGTGSGKSTLLHTMTLLHKPLSGEIRIFDEDIWNLDDANRHLFLNRCGVAFQFGALYNSLNALENINIALEENSKYPQSTINEISKSLVHLVGLDSRVYDLYPHQLSGGMQKRVGLARALALSPEILFLDEPTSGLDPASAQSFDELICELCDELDITIVMITHDLDSISETANRFLMLKNGKIEFLGTLKELKYQIPSLSKENLFHSKRGERLWKDA